MDRHTIVTPLEGKRDLDAMIRGGEAFFLANGYTRLEPGAGGEAWRGTRGRVGAGWRVSDMTQLHATVAVVVGEAGEGTLRHEVEVRGQRLSREDVAFWEREARLARAYMEGGEGEPKDLRPSERKRAERVRAHFVKLAMRGALTSFVVVSILGVMMVRMGCVHVS